MEDLKKLTLQNWTKQTNGGGEETKRRHKKQRPTHSHTGESRKKTLKYHNIYAKIFRVKRDKRMYE